MCLELGIDDPAKWLDETPRETVELWAAYWRLEPWGMPWHRHAVNCMLQDASEKPRRFKDWMPVDFENVAEAPEQTPELQLKMLRAMFGKGK